MKQVGVTLYKMDSKSKIRVWEIFVGEENGRNFYSVAHGQQNGQLQISKVWVDEGKNTGRSNETTAQSQCLFDAESLYKKQIARKGYTETIPTEVPNMPMLAHKFRDYSHKIEYPASVSPKINGIRLIITVKDGIVKTTTRTNKEMMFLNHITDELLALGKDFVLDGEIYHDDLELEEINHVVRKQKVMNPRMPEMYYHVFDIINDKTYHNRVLELEKLVKGLKNTKIVPWHIIKTEEQIHKYHKQFIDKKYEGTIIRNLNSFYQLNHRSYDLIKMKDFIDEEFEIIGWKVGKGKSATIPTFEFKMVDGKTFEAVPNGTAEIRAEYLRNAKNLIGKMATIKFFKYTKRGVPELPKMICIREY